MINNIFEILMRIWTLIIDTLKGNCGCCIQLESCIESVENSITEQPKPKIV